MVVGAVGAVGVLVGAAGAAGVVGAVGTAGAVVAGADVLPAGVPGGAGVADGRITTPEVSVSGITSGPFWPQPASVDASASASATDGSATSGAGASEWGRMVPRVYRRGARRAQVSCTTASVSRDTQVRFPASLRISISHTCVRRPMCSGDARPVTWPLDAGRRWLALTSCP